MNNQFIPEEVYSNLPDLLKKLTNGFLGRERDLVLISILGVLSCCLPKIHGKYDKKFYTPHLYVFIIAPPASGKGRMNLAALLIEEIHQTIKKNSLLKIAKFKKQNKGNNSNCPKLDVKIIPGNVSSAKVYSHLATTNHGLLIFESEADSISNMLKQDWGNFSDVLRKAFHHEKTSTSREIDDKFIEVNEPRLSVVLSGTVNQLAPLVKSKEDGLFSRFLYYYFDDIGGWRDVSPADSDIDYALLFSKAGLEVYNMYEQLINDEVGQIEFKLTEGQWTRLNVRMSTAISLVKKNYKVNFIPSLKRTGLIFFRICAILTAIRNKDNLTQNEELICNDVDFDIAENIIKVVLDHSISVSELFEKNPIELTMYEMNILSNLSKKFTRAEAIELAKVLDVPERTMDYNLNKLVKMKLLVKERPGLYIKTKGGN